MKRKIGVRCHISWQVIWRTVALLALVRCNGDKSTSCDKTEGLRWCKAMGECVPNWNFGECTRWAQIKDKQLKMKEAAAAGEEDVAAAARFAHAVSSRQPRLPLCGLKRRCCSRLAYGPVYSLFDGLTTRVGTLVRAGDGRTAW